MIISNLLIYVFFAGFSFLIFLIDTYFGLLSIVFGYLLLFLLNYKSNRSLFNYIQLYLISCFILSITQIFNLYNFDDAFFFEERYYFFYCVVITCIISIFFKLPEKNLTFIFDKKKIFEKKYLNYFFIFLWTFLISGIYGFFGGVLQYVLKNLFLLSPIIVASIYYLNSEKKIIPNIIFFLTFIFFTSIMFNRTGFLLVPIIFFITILIEKKFNLNFVKNFRFVLSAILLILFTLVISDLYKGSDARNFYSFLTDLKIKDFTNFLSETRFKINPNHNIYDYFVILDALTDENKEIGGNIFSQFTSSLKPRFFFPEKIITNISELNYVQGYISNRLFFAIFMEASYNLGLVGVFVYHLLILLIGKIMFSAVLKAREKLLFQLFSVHYFFYIIYIYIFIRGPGIQFMQFFFACFCIMIYYLYLSKKN